MLWNTFKWYMALTYSSQDTGNSYFRKNKNCEDPRRVQRCLKMVLKWRQKHEIVRSFHKMLLQRRKNLD